MVEMFCKEKAWLAFNLWSLIENDFGLVCLRNNFCLRNNRCIGSGLNLPHSISHPSAHRHFSHRICAIFLTITTIYFYLLKPFLRFYRICTFFFCYPFSIFSNPLSDFTGFTLFYYPPFQPFLSSQNLWNLSHYLLKPLIRFCRIFGIFLAITTIYIHLI